MRFSLPAAPSPAVLLALLAACRELERAGGHAAVSTNIKYIEAVKYLSMTVRPIFLSQCIEYCVQLRIVIKFPSPSNCLRMGP